MCMDATVDKRVCVCRLQSLKFVCTCESTSLLICVHALPQVFVKLNPMTVSTGMYACHASVYVSCDNLPGEQGASPGMLSA